jgi:hypothetical protein
MIFAFPLPFSSKFSSDAAFKTRLRNADDTRSLPVATRETVAILTPAAFATSCTPDFLPGCLVFFGINRSIYVRFVKTTTEL